MNSKLLIIIGILIASGSVATFTIIDVYQGQIEWQEKGGGLKDVTTIPSAEEFLKMDCKDLTHLFPEFPSVDVADAWNTRMHECINEQESLLLQTELEKWEEVSCLEVLNNPEMEFEDSVDKRAFDIRWKQCLENEK